MCVNCFACCSALRPRTTGNGRYSRAGQRSFGRASSRRGNHREGSRSRNSIHYNHELRGYLQSSSNSSRPVRDSRRSERISDGGPAGVHAGIESDRQGRFQHEDRPGQRDCRGLQRRAASPDRNHDVGHGHQFDNKRSAAAGNAELRPIDAAAAGLVHPDPSFDDEWQRHRRRRPPVRQRQPRTGQQLPAGRHGQQPGLRQPRRLLAERGCHRRSST